jgi:dipeptidyl aminopeptidase/acylaminoacyl peptidase
LVETIHRPYSYLTTYPRFPHDVEVWNTRGAVVAKVASQALADSVPIWGVRTGPREFAWRATEPATLTFAEALDGGDWNTKVPHRDRVMMLKAPFSGPPAEIARTEMRFSGFFWGDRSGLAFLNEVDLIRHWRRTSAINVDDRAAPPKVLWDLSSDERYKSPGSPVLRTLPNGYQVVHQEGDSIFLAGAGASPEGDRPFLDRFDLGTLRAERQFRSDRTSYEAFIAFFGAGTRQLITRRESPTDPPNYLVRTLGQPIADAPRGEATVASAPRAVTHLEDPTPIVRGITKRLVKYKRADGVDLSFTLYLPPGYKEGTRLPTIVWAYPLDYADAKLAGQVVGSDRRFTVLGWPLQLFAVLDGYAVVDNPSMPVVGDSNRIYDTYMEQLVSSAKAAVDKAVELGVTDRDRIGITGHSHGGLMTVNLLAHTDLFRAGVARSGAYNRSLTAFGFQNERRTLWEAPEVYVKVSPFFSADKVKSPLLLVHGEADVNPGTTPIQSEKLYEAVRGTGGTVRLVMLPFESHGYQAMESNEHVLYEMLAWFGKYVKNAAPRAAGEAVKK